MSPRNSRKTAKRIWTALAVLTALLWLWPVECRITRMAFAACAGASWLGALILWWKPKVIRFVLILAAALPALALSLPGRAPDRELLAADYARGLRVFRGVRYVWGGEGFLGVDCSGLVRKGLVWGQLFHGLRTLNGRPVRDAVALWWRDCSAAALRDGWRGLTAQLFPCDSIADADHKDLKPGDLAVTADGKHVMAYLGNRTWIEADPGKGKVVEVALPTDNPWFSVPVVFLRWRFLAGSESTRGAALQFLKRGTHALARLSDCRQRRGGA